MAQRRSHARILSVAVTVLLLLTARAASAQYTVQVLLPPNDIPFTATTRALAINNSGQIFGYIIYNFVARPVLWTNGVPQYLQIPSGYDWAADPGDNFINDSGRAVSQVVPSGGPGFSRRIVYWDNGGAPQLVPLPPEACAYPNDVHADVAWGLNNAGHVLFGNYGTDGPGGPQCGNLWRWDGGSSFQLLVSLIPDGPFVCSNIYSLRASRSHLNDADHVALDYGPVSYPNPTCTNTKAGGILIGSSFTPIVADVGLGGGASDFNNSDQLLAGNADDMKFWDGFAIVTSFVTFTYPSLNDLGQVMFWDHGAPKIYESGTVTDVVLPPVPNALSTGPGSIINSVGQILSGSLIQYSGPFGAASEQAVLFTPRTPVITWPKPADITYGTSLSSVQLNATANVPGTFVYSPAAGTVLAAAAIQPLSVTFTPDDLTLYDPTTASTSIGVLSAPLTVKADDANKVFGAPLPAFSASFIGFVNGDGPGDLLGSLTLTTGATSTSPVGVYPITPGGVSSPNYIISFVPGTLTIAPASTTTSIQALPATTGVLQPVILIATVAPVAPGAGTVDGTLQFKDGASLLGTATVANGLAFLLVNGLAPGAHTIAAAYAGTGNFAPSTSPGTGVTIQSLAASSFTLMFPLTQPQVIGQPAVFLALVVGLGGGPVPTGTVQFVEGNTVLGSAPLNASGIAIFSTPAFGAGVHVIGARYLGGGVYAPSTASPAAQTIYAGARPASTGISLTTAPNPSTVDEPVSFTATVTGATAGTVVFFIDGFALGGAPIVDVGGSFQATFTLTGLLSAGAHVVSAAYAGSPGFSASTLSVPAVQVIQLPDSLSSEMNDSLESLLATRAAGVLRKWPR